jgi:hypothetical protein
MHKLKAHKTVEQIAKKHRLEVSFIQKQLDMGEPIEHEHTKDHELAMDIALQHLDEIPDYYTRLKKMEASAKKEHSKFKDVKESMDEQRYCPLCDKRETRSECSYGEKAWDKVSIKDHEYSMARSELKTIADAVKRLQMKVGKGEGSLEAWVQSKITKAADYIDTAADYVASGEMEESVRLPATNGNIISVIISWRGKTYMNKMFFPQVNMPSRREITDQIQKVYPGASVLQYNVAGLEPGQPLIQVYDRQKSKNYLLNNGTIGEETIEEVAAWQRKEGKNQSGGLNEKGRKSYERENPGSDLKAPSKKVGNPRRASFCARMKGMKKKLTSSKTASDPNSRINKSLRAWNC